MRALCLLIGTWLGLSGALWAQTPFTARVQAHFQEWDLNHDGRLSPDEIDRAMQDPRIQGADAAALATLKVVSRKSKKRDPWLCSQQSLEEYASDLSAGRKPPRSLDSTFKTMQSRLAQASTELSAPGGPHLEAIRQVSGGDCYFLAVVLGMLARNPQEIRSLIEPRPDGTFFVRFPGGSSHQVRAPTAAERAVYTDDRGDGLWLYVLLRAFGEERMDGNRRFADMTEPGDATDSGGASKLVMKIMTGTPGQVTSIGPNGNSARQKWVRRALTQAFREHRLVVLGTPKAGQVQMPKGIATSHAMAVLAYDERQDLVTIRNPWGNTLTPSGPPEVAGFPTRDGLFTMPVSLVVRYFKGLCIQGGAH